jgi:hypothetical protein
MAKFFRDLDLMIERISLQQKMTELNSSANKRSFLRDKGSKLSFKALITSLSTLSTIHIRIIVEDTNNFHQFLQLIDPRAFLAVGK